MIYDCFTYWKEEEILFLRLKHLWNYVDKFVIVEADVTHRGIPKPWNLERLLEGEFSWAKDKIIYIKKHIDVSGLNLHHVSESWNPTSDFWKIENAHRNAIMDGLQDTDPNDIIMISDVDEIPTLNVMAHIEDVFKINSMELVEKYKVNLISSGYQGEELETIIAHLTDVGKLVPLSMRTFNYYMNTETKLQHSWRGTVIGRRYIFNHCTPQVCRDNRTFLDGVKNGGYHFTWIGEEHIREKFKNTAHDELQKFDTEENIKTAMQPNEEGVFVGWGENRAFLVDVESDPEYPRIILEDERFSRFLYKK